MNLEDLLGSWTKPSSDTERDKQERTERMVKKAISDHPAFHDCTLSTYMPRVLTPTTPMFGKRAM